MRLCNIRRSAVSLAVIGAFAMQGGQGNAQESDDSVQEQSEESGTKEKSKKSKKSDVANLSDDSASNRQGKIAGVDLGYGLTIGGLPGMNLHGYYNLNSDFSLGLLYSSGSLDLSSVLSDTADISITEAAVSGSIVGLAARYYTGNSFYLLGGIGQRNVEMSIGLKSTVLDYGIEGGVEVDSTVIVFAIGNQWQWSSGFSLGVEWFGYATPIGAKASSDFNETGALASTVAASTKADMEKLRKDAQDAGEALGETGSARLFVISLGWAF
jgi:hypothetical protein